MKNVLNIFARHENVVLRALALGDGACHDIEARTGMLHQTASATLTHLRNRGCIKDTGERRLTPSRRPATVYTLTKNHIAAQIKYLDQNNITPRKGAK